MSPDQRSDRTAAAVTACLGCGGPLNGNQLACPLCVKAAEIACRQRQPGQSVLPSDIAKIREMLG